MRTPWFWVGLPQTCHKWTRFLFPVGIFCLMNYGIWAFSHKLCYDHIHKYYGHSSIAIALIITVCFLQIVLLLTWFQIAVTVGPGKLPRILPNLLLQPQDSISDGHEKNHDYSSVCPPICYQCDSSGYPIWCSNCQGLKTERAHHSGELGHCVPKFDHKCIWLGSIIGKDNYRLFIQYCVFMTIWLAIIWSSILAYMRNIVKDYRRNSGSHLNANIIVLFILSTLCWIMVTSLLLTQLNCIINNRTSIEVLERKRSLPTRRMFCYYNPSDGCRYVVELSKKEYSCCWSKDSWWTNAAECLGSNIFMWIIPWGTSVPKRGFISDEINNRSIRSNLEAILGPYKENMSDKTMDLIRRKISNGEYLTRLQLHANNRMGYLIASD